MTPEKGRRLADAIGYLSGVLAAMDALRDSKSLFPLDVMWQGLRRPQRLELVGGIAVIVVTLVVSAVRRRSA